MEDIYVMQCGCRLSKNEVIFKKGGRKCPVHEKSIDRIIRQCPDCGEIMNLAGNQWAKLRCDSCQEKRRRKIHAECCANWRKKQNGNVATWGMNAAEKACGDRWDCIHRRGCIDDAIQSGRGHKPLPCDGCDRYEARMAI